MRSRFALMFAILCVGTPSSVVAEELSFEDGAAVITGEVLKPEITVVMSRENLNKSYDLELKESFLQKIIDSVEQPPF